MSSESPWFSIGYRKKNGVWGHKAKVRRVAGKGGGGVPARTDMHNISREVRIAGTMELETDGGHRFEIKAIGLMEFNEKKIDHRF